MIEKWGLLLTLLSVFFAGIALYYAKKSYKLSKIVAVNQGGFKVGNLQAYFFGKSHIKKDYFPDMIIVSGPIVKDKVMLLPLPVTVTSTGSATINEVQVNIRYSPNLRVVPSNILETTLINQSPPSFKYSIYDNGNYRFSQIDLGDLHPGMGVNFNDSIMFNESSFIRDSISAKTKDKVNISFKYSVLLYSSIDITIFQRNEKPLSKRINVMVFDENERSLEDQILEYNSKIERKLDKRSFFEKVKYVFSNNKSKQIDIIRYQDSDLSKNEDNLLNNINLKKLHRKPAIMLASNIIVLW